MSFSLKAVQEEAHDLRVDLAHAIGHDREQRVLDVLKHALENVVKELGGYIAISGSGHINESEDLPGDSISVNVSSLPRPDGPTAPDQSIAPHTDPPEGTVATPMTADGSPPAQPAPPVPGPTEQAPPTEAEVLPTGANPPVPGGAAIPGAEAPAETQASPLDQPAPAENADAVRDADKIAEELRSEPVAPDQQVSPSTEEPPSGPDAPPPPAA